MRIGPSLKSIERSWEKEVQKTLERKHLLEIVLKVLETEPENLQKAVKALKSSLDHAIKDVIYEDD